MNPARLPRLIPRRRAGALLVGGALALIAVGLPSAPGASPPHKTPSVHGFLTAVRAAGIAGLDPALLEDGYSVCWQLWNQHTPGRRVAAGLQRDYPTLNSDQAARFVVAAYENLCPVPGAYDCWAYSTG